MKNTWKGIKKDLRESPPWLKIILSLSVGIGVLADGVFGMGVLLGVLVSAISAAILGVAVYIICEKGPVSFANIVFLAISGLMEKYTGVNLLDRLVKDPPEEIKEIRETEKS